MSTTTTYTTSPPTESLLEFWDEPVCVQDGYCSNYCAAINKGDSCLGDGHCLSKNMMPPGAYTCREGNCGMDIGFWEVRPGLALPMWMDWVLYPWVQGYKKLKSNTCSLTFWMKLGAGATVELNLSGTQRNTQTRLKFRIRLETTDLLAYTEQPHEYDNVYYYDYEGEETPIISGADTTGMVNSETMSVVDISWCDGIMSIGPSHNPTLVSGETGAVEEIVYLAGTSSGPESYLKVARNVADEWLFDEDGTDADPIFAFGDSMITRQIEPSTDVTVKYDCKAEEYCSVFFRSAYPSMLTVYVGGWHNSACGIAYNDSRHGPYLLKQVTGPVLSATEFNTFTVRYSSGAVTVFMNDAIEPIYDVTVPTPLPPITSVGIGSMFWGSWKEVRVARYDPAWRTDTWKTDGTGFFNMDAKLL